MIIVALLALIIFGPGKATSMARELGSFVKEARRSAEDFKSELADAGEEDRSEPAVDLHPGNDKDGTPERAAKSELPGKGEKEGASLEDDARVLAE